MNIDPSGVRDRDVITVQHLGQKLEWNLNVDTEIMKKPSFLPFLREAAGWFWRRWTSSSVFGVSGFWVTCSFHVGTLESFSTAQCWLVHFGVYLRRQARSWEWLSFKKLLDIQCGTIKGAWSLCWGCVVKGRSDVPETSCWQMKILLTADVLMHSTSFLSAAAILVKWIN